MRIVIGDLEEHPDNMSEEEFIEIVKAVYGCARRGIYFGPVTKDRVKIQNGKTVIIPNFEAPPPVVSGRIENPISFFTTVRTLANVFKKSKGWISRIRKEKISAIFQLMKELSLEITDSRAFLPSLGIWRHDKFVQRLKETNGPIFVPMIDARNFIPLISNMGKTFYSLEDIREEVLKEKTWHNIFPSEKEIFKSDLTALAFLFPVNENEVYIFNTANSVEMHVFCNELRKIYPKEKIVEFLEPCFKMNIKKTIIPPRISKEELPWFLKTFFGSEARLNTDVSSLFVNTKGEIFAISNLILKGKWKFVDGIWEVYPASYEPLSSSFLLKKARTLSRTGERPTLGLELVKTAENISQRNLEAFESLKAFFYKALGKYTDMDFYFKKAEEFSNRSFRNAFYSIVLAMNNMEFSLLKEKSTPLVNIMRKYATMILNFKSINDFYTNIISPLEKIRTLQARRIECMARNYIGTMLENDGKTEEAIDEYETALSMAQEYKFKDLEPLIELNIAFALTDITLMKSTEKALEASKKAMSVGLKKIIAFSYMVLASNSIEMGEIKRGNFFLSNAKRIHPSMSPSVKALEARIKVEDLEFDDIESIEDGEEKEFLKLLSAFYVNDEKKIEEILKNSKTPRIKKLSIYLENPDFEEAKNENVDYLAAYFLARHQKKANMSLLKKLGEYIYINNVNIRKIFYEEQLSNAYRNNNFEKSADYHMSLAASIARQLGLKRRASYLSKKIKSKSFMKKSYELFSFYMAHRYFDSTYEIARSLASTISKLLGVDILCHLEGIESYTFHASPEGIIWNTIEKPDPDFSWVFGEEWFVYYYPMRNNILYIGFKTKNVDMDEALLTLDHLVPFYAVHIEKSIANKVSNVDSLTQIYSRRYIMNRLEEEVERAQRYGESLSVAMVDVDDFKRVNDKNGHDVGDEVLKRIAELIADNTRSIDIVGRYGGEEFLIIFPHTPLEHALKSCERIRKKAESSRIIPSHLTISIGVAQLEKSDNVDGVVKKADIALYLAKSYGKNRVVPYLKKRRSEL